MTKNYVFATDEPNPRVECDGRFSKITCVLCETVIAEHDGKELFENVPEARQFTIGEQLACDDFNLFFDHMRDAHGLVPNVFGEGSGDR